MDSLAELAVNSLTLLWLYKSPTLSCG